MSITNPFLCDTDLGDRNFSNFCTSLPSNNDTKVSSDNDKYFTGHDFCTLPGPAGDFFRQALCSYPEWNGSENTSLCTFSSCHLNQQRSDVCLYCFPAPGTKAFCNRIRYNGDPLDCCFADMIYDWNIAPSEYKNQSHSTEGFYQSDKCILSENHRDQTCDPQYRDITNAQCQSLSTPYCSGIDVQNDSWMLRWDNSAPEPVCPNGNECSKDGSCVNGICHYPSDNGGPCTINTECRGGEGTCSNGTCQYSLGRLNGQWIGGVSVHNSIAIPPSPIPDDNLSNLSPCQYYMYRLLYLNPVQAGGDVPVPLNPTTIPQFQQHINESTYPTGKLLFKEMLAKYSLKYTLGTTPGNPGYNQFQNQIFSLCSTVPGLCDDALSELCSSVTPNDLSSNPELQRWCGCFMSEEQYQQYTQEFQISKMCTPWCAGPMPFINAEGQPSGGPLRPSDDTGLNFNQCCQSSCVIDNGLINLANTSVNGQVNINQVCAGCVSALSNSSSQAVQTCKQQGFDVTSECTCILKDTTIDVAASIIGGNVSLSQFCSGGTTCYRTNPLDPNGPNVVVDCSTQDSAEFKQLEEQAQANANAVVQKQLRQAVIFLLIVFGVTALIILLLWAISR